MKTNSGRFFVFGAIFAGLAVGAGAFGAHFLKPVLDAPMLAVLLRETVGHHGEIVRRKVGGEGTGHRARSTR